MHKEHRWLLKLFVIDTLITAVPGLTACKEIGLVQMILGTDKTLAVFMKAEMPKVFKRLDCLPGVSPAKDQTGEWLRTQMPSGFQD